MHNFDITSKNTENPQIQQGNPGGQPSQIPQIDQNVQEVSQIAFNHIDSKVDLPLIFEDIISKVPQNGIFKIISLENGFYKIIEIDPNEAIFIYPNQQLILPNLTRSTSELFEFFKGLHTFINKRPEVMEQVVVTDESISHFLAMVKHPDTEIAELAADCLLKMVKFKNFGCAFLKNDHLDTLVKLLKISDNKQVEQVTTEMFRCLIRFLNPDLNLSKEMHQYIFNHVIDVIINFLSSDNDNKIEDALIGILDIDIDDIDAMVIERNKLEALYHILDKLLDDPYCSSFISEGGYLKVVSLIKKYFNSDFFVLSDNSEKCEMTHSTFKVMTDLLITLGERFQEPHNFDFDQSDFPLIQIRDIFMDQIYCGDRNLWMRLTNYFSLIIDGPNNNVENVIIKESIIPALNQLMKSNLRYLKSHIPQSKGNIDPLHFNIWICFAKLTQLKPFPEAIVYSETMDTLWDSFSFLMENHNGEQLHWKTITCCLGSLIINGKCDNELSQSNLYPNPQHLSVSPKIIETIAKFLINQNQEVVSNVTCLLSTLAFHKLLPSEKVILNEISPLFKSNKLEDLFAVWSYFGNLSEKNEFIKLLSKSEILQLMTDSFSYFPENDIAFLNYALNCLNRLIQNYHLYQEGAPLSISQITINKISRLTTHSDTNIALSASSCLKTLAEKNFLSKELK